MKPELYECVKDHCGIRQYKKGIVYEVILNDTEIHGKWWHTINMEIDTYTGGGQVLQSFLDNNFKKVK